GAAVALLGLARGEGGTPGVPVRRITGEVQRMQESYGEGPATHTGPESGVAARKGGREAMIGVVQARY
ncbi:MAG: hypothetical protein AB1671_23705, partial [Thermodesulfobacteriota bacterium]